MVAFEAALQSWAALRWDAWKERQHSKLRELADEEAVVLEGRKSLVRQTKELRALTEGEQAQRRPELFKLYQQEIDRFASIIKKLHAGLKSDVLELCNLPDPVPILAELLEQSSANDGMTALQEENAGLRNALKKAGLEVADLSGKLRSKDASLQSGEGQIKHHMAQVIGLRQELEQKDSSINELIAALAEQEKQAMVATNRLQEACKRGDELSIEVGRLKKTNGELHGDLREQSRKKSQEEGVQWAEFDVLNLNLRAARAQIVELQGENKVLRADLASAQDKDFGGVGGSLIKRLEEEITELHARAKTANEEHLHQIGEKDRQLLDLQEKVKGTASLEESLRELKVLKTAEFPDQYEPELNQSLETLLRGRVKKLEGELVNVSGQNRSLSKRLDDLESELTIRSGRIVELEKIVEQYETSTTSPLLQTDAISLNSTSTTSAQNADSVITILTSQRDRLKKQKEDLEDKYTSVHQQSESQKIELSRLRSDNAKLFERIKFLSGPTRDRLDGSPIVDSELGGLLHQQQPVYGARLYPFRFFFQNVPPSPRVPPVLTTLSKELVKRLKSLGQADRVAWGVGKVLLTNKFIRKLLIVYFVAFHILVIYVVTHH